MSACTLQNIVVSGVVQKCVVCQAQPAVQAVPTQFVVENAYNWNASAYSKYTRYGNCRLKFGMYKSIGVIVGISPVVSRTASIPEISHGFYFCADAGKHKWGVIENGVLATSLFVQETEEPSYVVERVDSVVRYYVDGSLIHTSARVSTTPVKTHAWLYAPTDKVP